MKLSRRTEAETKPFDGTLEGVPITAAFNWTQSGKQLVYFFAGRHLCKQEISETDWVPMCNIKDIADLVIGCTADEDGSALTYVIVLVVIVLIVVFIVFLWLYKSNEKPKSDAKPQQNVSNASEVSDTRSELK